MPFKRKPEGTALSHWPQWRIAHKIAWRYRKACGHFGVEWQEIAYDCVAHLWRATSNHNPAIATIGTYLEAVAVRYFQRRLESLRVVEANMAGYQFESIELEDMAGYSTELFDRLLAVLDDRRYRIIRMRLDGKTLAEVAVVFKVSRERIRQVEAKALRQMRIEAARIASKAGCSTGEFFEVRGVA